MRGVGGAGSMRSLRESGDISKGQSIPEKDELGLERILWGFFGLSDNNTT